MNDRISFMSRDSKLFARNIFEINYEKDLTFAHLKDIDNECRLCNAYLVFIKVNSEDIKTIHFLEKLGFNYMECKYKLRIRLQKAYDIPHYKHFYLKKIEKLNIKSVEEISKIVETTFVTDRYYIDPKIEKGLSGKRYKNWFINSFDDESYETYKYCFKSNNKIAAFLMIRREKSEIELVLAGVAPQFKNIGIFPSMLIEYLNMCYLWGEKSFYGFISGLNIDVFNIYNYLGFKIVDQKIVMRKIYERAKS